MSYATLASCAAALAALAPHVSPAARPQPSISVANVDANARAEGNRRATAVALGRVLFVRTWPVQIVKVRVDGIGSHQVAGLVLSGVKFHGSVDERRFSDEVRTLVRRTFAAVPVEEVDVWATTPLDVARGTVVSGDNAQPAARVVFTATVRRSDLRAFAGRLAAGDGIYWNAAWRESLGRTPGARRETQKGRSRRLGVAEPADHASGAQFV